MYQSNNPFHEALIAATKILENGPLNWNLKKIRKKNILFRPVKNLSSKSCVCDDPNEEIKIIPLLYPIFPSQGDSCKGYFSSLPFYYVIVAREFRVIPIVDVIEVPILENQFIFENEEKDNLDKILSGIGKTQIVSNKKISNENFSQELNKIRKNVISKIFDFFTADATLFFSTFQWDNNFNCDVNNKNFINYFAALKECNEKISWEFQSIKIMPIKNKSIIYSIQLNSWALGKGEV